ncbi:VOC family protein [Streptococcus sp. HF-1907]|uniref:CppA N-terminal domain-containing protein n=1 Tax=Streptococcus sp. HF-1907 TaxID=2785793 RepID=UPI0018A10A82|nr:CppA N-terminal domain-containing protein [Streptococcus sp. HF-1907]MBF7094449.1 VOC family protein [Streptococcus sp. HF-1907]
MTLFNAIRFNHPVLRVNNRDQNIAFYQKSLGLRLVSEENALAIFSAWENKETSFVIEESPSMRTRAVEGPKKLSQIRIKVFKASDIVALLGNGASASRVFQGKNGYAYETISPEGDHFLVHAEDDVADLVDIDRPELSADDTFKGLSDFTYEAITLNVADKGAAQDFYNQFFNSEFPVILVFNQAEGPDLAIEPNVTWDIEILECQVPKDYDLSALKDFMEAKGASVYLDRKETVLVISDLSKIEIWIEKR